MLRLRQRVQLLPRALVRRLLLFKLRRRQTGSRQLFRQLSQGRLVRLRCLQQLLCLSLSLRKAAAGCCTLRPLCL